MNMKMVFVVILENGYISVNNITYFGDFNSEIEIDLCATSSVDKLENINDIYILSKSN